MKKYKNDAQLYLEMYPNLKKKQINQCIVCQRQGYKPEHPDIHPNIQRYFEPLPINSTGLCEMCEDASKVID